MGKVEHDCFVMEDRQRRSGLNIASWKVTHGCSRSLSLHSHEGVIFVLYRRIESLRILLRRNQLYTIHLSTIRTKR